MQINSQAEYEDNSGTVHFSAIHHQPYNPTPSLNSNVKWIKYYLFHENKT